MNEQVFEVKLNELVQEIGRIPAGAESQILTKETHTSQKGQEAGAGLENSLDRLAISIKYLLFDLEATRRENDFLKTLIDNTES